MADEKVNEDSLPDEEKLKIWVDRLRMNDEKVLKELLKTKYQKPYRELKEKIKEVANRILNSRMTEGIVIRNDEAGQELLKKMQALIKEKEEAGYNKELGRILCKEYDTGKFLQAVKQMHTEMWNLWITYWQGYCCLYVLPENWEEPYPPPRIYNELTDEFLVDEEKNIWEKHPEWKSEQRTIITAGACSLLVGAKKGETTHGQTGEHKQI